jgi:hypothetical protein
MRTIEHLKYRREIGYHFIEVEEKIVQGQSLAKLSRHSLKNQSDQDND